MRSKLILYISKRSQRIVAAFLSLALIHLLVASCAPEAAPPVQTGIWISR